MTDPLYFIHVYTILLDGREATLVGRLQDFNVTKNCFILRGNPMISWVYEPSVHATPYESIPYLKHQLLSVKALKVQTSPSSRRFVVLLRKYPPPQQPARCRKIWFRSFSTLDLQPMTMRKLFQCSR